MMEVSVCMVIMRAFMCPCSYLQNILFQITNVLSCLRKTQQPSLLLLYDPATRHLKMLHKQAPLEELLHLFLNNPRIANGPKPCVC